MTTIQSYPHSLPFDPTYGFDLPGLQAVVPPPPFPGFEAFWREAYASAQGAPLAVTREAAPELDKDGFRVELISFLAADGRRIGGWLTIPTDRAPQCAIVTGHGYGGREAPDYTREAIPAIRLFFCARGFHRSADPALPDHASAHVIHGIECRDGYILRGCALDLWAAVGALLEVAPEHQERLYYEGSSFGGGLGALAVPWDGRIRRCHLRQPTFGNHPFRLQVPCTGSGESVRQYVGQHPEAVEVLRYFDSATTAAFLKIPVFASLSLFDPAVPAPGQFAVYNAIPGSKKLFMEPAGHFDYPEAWAVGREGLKQVNDFFACPIS